MQCGQRLWQASQRVHWVTADIEGVQLCAAFQALHPANVIGLQEQSPQVLHVGLQSRTVFTNSLRGLESLRSEIDFVARGWMIFI